MERFGFIFVLLFIFNECHACFKESSKTSRMFPSGSSIFEECCCTETDDTMKLEWLDPILRPVGKLGPDMSSDMYIEEQGNCLSLHIPKSSSAMSGTFTCHTRYKGEWYYQERQLDIYDPLTFRDTPPKQTITEGIDSVVGCWSKGASKPLNRWYRIINNEPVEIVFQENNKKYYYYEGDLLIHNVDANDVGVYRCSASVLSTGEETEMDITVTVATKPVIKNLTAPIRPVLAGEPLTLECEAEGFPEPSYEWKKLPETTGEPIRWKQTVGTIRIDSAEPRDGGIYECTAQNQNGRAQKQTMVEVHYSPVIIEFSNITAVEGSEKPLFCNVTGYPIPNVTISYEGLNLDEDKPESYEVLIPNYSLFKVDRTKAGYYICNASNSVDFTSEIMYVTVQFKPYFERISEEVWGWAGKTVELNCSHESNPPSNITWIYRAINSTSVMKVKINEDNPMVLTYAINDQFPVYGEYICKAENILGDAIKSIKLRRGFPPSYVQEANTVEATATSIIFSIEPPLDYEGPEVIGFIAEYDEESNYNITDVHPNRTWGLERPFKLDNLKPNTTYNIRFAAINEVGQGPYSGIINFVTLEKSAPEPPIFESDALQIGSNKILKWKAPRDNGDPIDAYILRYCPVDAKGTQDCKEHRLNEVSEVELDELELNKTYNFELKAHNAQGYSSTANVTATLPVTMGEAAPILSGGAIIGISVIVVLICLLLLDVLLYVWKRQGIIATCCKKNKRKSDTLNPREGFLKDNGDSASEDLLRRPNNGHREFEYNKTTGTVTGKHSDV